MSIPADIAALETELNLSFNWNGTDYPCLASSAARRRSLESGGFGVDADLVIFVRTELLGDTRPTPKQTLTYNSRSYRVEEVVTPAGEPFLKLVCTDAAKGV